MVTRTRLNVTFYVCGNCGEIYKLKEGKDLFSYCLTIVRVKLQLMPHAVGYRRIVIVVFVEAENIGP